MANDLQSQINQARQAGYSDDEISQHLAGSDQTLGPKIKQASGAGYSSKEILDHLSSPATPSAPVTPAASAPAQPTAPAPPWYDRPLVHNLEDYIAPAKGEDAKSIWGAVKNTARGAIQGAESMSSPKGIAMTAGLIGLNAIPVVGELADTYAGLSGAHDVINQGVHAYHQIKSGDAEGGENSIGQVLPGAALSGVGLAKAAPKVATVIKHPVDAVREVMAPTSTLDTEISPGEWTPRERFNTAKDLGVTLNKSDAVGGKGIFGTLQRLNRNSLLGHRTQDASATTNSAALNGAADQLIDSASDVPMSQTEFGDAAKAALAEHKTLQLNQAEQMYKDLAAENGDSPVDMGGIRGLAQQVADSKKTLITSSPRSATNGVKNAYGIARELANGAPEAEPSPLVDASGKAMKSTTEVPDTMPYGYLSELRSNLLSKVRDGELTDGPGSGMVKQLISNIDDAMMNSLSPVNQEKFRTANDIYRGVQETHNDVTHPFHTIGNAQTGMGAADQVSNLRPEQATDLRNAFDEIGRPDLNGQMQRQTLQRIIKPNTSDMKNKTLTQRLKNINQERLAGVLSPDQVNGLRDIGKVADAIHYDWNPSGTAKANQQNAEGRDIFHALAVLAGGGSHLAGVPTPLAAIPAAYAVGQYPLARFLTHSGSTDFMMQPRVQFSGGHSILPALGKGVIAGGALDTPDIKPRQR